MNKYLEQLKAAPAAVVHGLAIRLMSDILRAPYAYRGDGGEMDRLSDLDDVLLALDELGYWPSEEAPTVFYADPDVLQMAEDNGTEGGALVALGTVPHEGLVPLVKLQLRQEASDEHRHVAALEAGSATLQEGPSALDVLHLSGRMVSIPIKEEPPLPSPFERWPKLHGILRKIVANSELHINEVLTYDELQFLAAAVKGMA